ncbi:MAG TPA: neutral/alkaline non-lysosomal ceramidase N-terminal domain-containing protein [Bryocella sp.]|nr:neutral/alkaline non-lysosomal ceramidase N-terminal domain-containing protein [Bryocella sp.]
MPESKNQLIAGWARTEVVPPSHYPMAGYLARMKASRGSLTSLYVRALVLQQPSLRACIIVADLLLISPAWAARLRKRIAAAVAVPAGNVIVAATHTHSGPLVDTAPFRFSHSEAGKRTCKFMRELEEIFVQTAVTAWRTMQPVRASYKRVQIHGLATDRNHPKKNHTQQFVLLRLKGAKSSTVFGVLPCHPTALGADNLYYSGDLHGEIARRYERQFNVALIANGACANISTRFTRRNQTPAQMSRFAALVMRQAETTPFHACAPGAMSIASRSVRIPVKNFRHFQVKEDARLIGRLADVAREGRLVANQLRLRPEFRCRSVPVSITLLSLGPLSFAAFPFELYAETGRFLWAKARTTALCYANGYWGYVYIPEASLTGYEVISSPFAAGGDNRLREAVLSLAGKA